LTTFLAVQRLTREAPLSPTMEGTVMRPAMAFVLYALSGLVLTKAVWLLAPLLRERRPSLRLLMLILTMTTVIAFYQARQRPPSRPKAK
jgi:hypothetical protein